MAIYLLLLLLLPAVLIFGAQRVRLLGAIGPTVLAYAVGIVWGNSGLPAPTESLAMSVVEAVVPLAIPLLLFSTHLAQWWRLARTTALSFGLQIVAVLIASALGAWLFTGRVAEATQIAGMFVGVYVGGTANLTAIGLALGVSRETFIMTNAADVLMGALYLLFLMSVAQRFLLRFLPAFAPKAGGDAEADVAAAPEAHAVKDLVKGIGLGGALAAGAVGAAAGLSLLLTGKLSEILVILLITTAGIAASMAKQVRALPGTYDAGQYLMLVFCLAIGTVADFSRLGASPTILLYCGFVMFLAILLHFGLAALFRIDADTVIITSTAGIFSPAFVGPVAAALKNREIVVSGMTAGVVGLATGTYLGIALAWVLSL